jgi:saccharopine dehydrogenase-like NADP-dependent oxidoreductase
LLDAAIEISSFSAAQDGIIRPKRKKVNPIFTSRRIPMKRVLLLGAGLVARPLVRYLLEQPEIELTIATRTVSKAEKLIAGHPRGRSLAVDVEQEAELKALVAGCDLAISLLPWIHHLKVARLCLDLGKHLVTTSYVKPEMQALDAEAKEKGLLFLNEIGVDPGIDHMAAMKVINGVKNDGGKVTSFYSYCGGLPALESNTNPLGYKFSWSPVGVMLAAGNDGRYLKDGEVVEVPGIELFEHYWLVSVPGSATFEAYINRDSLPYIEVYNIPEVKSMYRGTLRNISHCESWNYFKKLGLLDQKRMFDFAKTAPAGVLATLAGGPGKNLAGDVADYLGIPEHSIAIKKLEWLGLFGEEKLPLGNASVFDMFAHILLEKLVFEGDEVDLLVQHHEFIAEYPDRKEMITSTMVDTGIPGGDSSMARTVSLPAAIATRLILEGKISRTGVCIPVVPDIYEPVLAELETMNIKLTERKKVL